MTDNTTIPNWLEEEQKGLPATTQFVNRTSILEFLSEGKTVDLSFDLTKPFKTYPDQENKVTKKIIECVLHKEDGKIEDVVWFLNVKNPVYSEILTKLKSGITRLKIKQTGTGKKTRYEIVA